MFVVNEQLSTYNYNKICNMCVREKMPKYHKLYKSKSSVDFCGTNSYVGCLKRNASKKKSCKYVLMLRREMCISL